jgi:hypothetical protein
MLQISSYYLHKHPYAETFLTYQEAKPQLLSPDEYLERAGIQ